MKAMRAASAARREDNRTHAVANEQHYRDLKDRLQRLSETDAAARKAAAEQKQGKPRHLSFTYRSGADVRPFQVNQTATEC